MPTHPSISVPDASAQHLETGPQVAPSYSSTAEGRAGSAEQTAVGEAENTPSRPGSRPAAAAPPLDTADYADRVLGAFLGAVCGDVLGAAVEGKSSAALMERFPQGLTEFQKTKRGFGCYTDDTQMLVALARSLVALGCCDAADASRAYAAEFQPHRGYGHSAFMILGDLREGADWRTTAQKYIPAGSFGNGGAMRIAPVGLAYRHASPGVLLQAVKDALAATHSHVLGIDGALIQAAAVAVLCTSAAAPWPPGCDATPADSRVIDTGDKRLSEHEGPVESQPVTGAAAAVAIAAATIAAHATSADLKGVNAAAAMASTMASSASPSSQGGGAAVASAPSAALGAAAAAEASRAGGGDLGGMTPLLLLQRMAKVANSDDMCSRLELLAQDFSQVPAHQFKQRCTPWSSHFQSEGWAAELAVARRIAEEFQIRATDAAASALCALAFHWGQPEDAVVAAVHYGGDTDTIACMAGALAGALHGSSWLPAHWVGNLENGRAGRDDIVRLAGELAGLRCGQSAGSL